TSVFHHRKRNDVRTEPCCDLNERVQVEVAVGAFHFAQGDRSVRNAKEIELVVRLPLSEATTLPVERVWPQVEERFSGALLHAVQAPDQRKKSMLLECFTHKAIK